MFISNLLMIKGEIMKRIELRDLNKNYEKLLRDVHIKLIDD